MRAIERTIDNTLYVSSVHSHTPHAPPRARTHTIARAHTRTHTRSRIGRTCSPEHALNRKKRGVTMKTKALHPQPMCKCVNVLFDVFFLIFYSFFSTFLLCTQNSERWMKLSCNSSCMLVEEYSKIKCHGYSVYLLYWYQKVKVLNLPTEKYHMPWRRTS